MFAKLIGLLLIVIGGYIAFKVLFPLIGSLFGLGFLLLKLALAIGCFAVGYRLIRRD